MAADLHRIIQRMEKQVPNRTGTPLHRWLLLALCLVVIVVLVVSFGGG